MHDLTHIDLFSGSGAFSLAAERAGFRTLCFVESEPFCQAILKKHWPRIPIYNDIKTFRWAWRRPTLISGGFPCQPFSSAGRKKGKADHRNLWPDMLRVISEIRPAWVIAENVTHIAYMVLADCENDLEAEGYEVQSFDIPACSCGLPTMERHIWIVAASRSEHMEGRGQKRLSREQEMFSRFGRANDKNAERFPGIPDLCPPELYRSRKGIPHWMDRHKMLGNAIVPQVAYQIIKTIAEIEED